MTPDAVAQELDPALTKIVNDLLTQLGEFEPEIAGAEAEVAAAKAKLGEIKARERRVVKTVEYLTGKPAPGHEPKPKKRAAGNGKGVSDETIARVQAFLEKLEPGDDATIREISDATKVHLSPTRAALDYMRDEEIVRQTRKRRAKGSSHGMKAAAFALMNGADS